MLMDNPFDFKTKLLHNSDHVAKILKGERPFPLQLEVDLANICNHACSFCNMADTLSSDNSVLDTSILLNTLQDAFVLGSRAISFTGGGEPTTHRDFASISYEARSIGFDLGLITNAALLTSSRSKAVVDNFQWVRISMGGPTPESYSSIQGKDDFHRVLNNVRALSLARNSESKPLNIGLKFVLCESSYQHLPDFVHYLDAHHIDGSNVDYIQLVPNQYTSDGGNFISSTPLLNAIDQLRSLLANLNIPLHSSFYSVSSDDRDLSFSKHCFAHFFQAVITADGDFTYCKNTRDTSALHLGNIYHRSLEDIWNAESTMSLESHICAANCNTFCKSLALNNIFQSLVDPAPGYSSTFF